MYRNKPDCNIKTQVSVMYISHFYFIKPGAFRLCRWFIWALNLPRGVLWFLCCLLKLKSMSKSSDGTSDLE